MEDVNKAWLALALAKQELDKVINARVLPQSTILTLYNFLDHTLRVYQIADLELRAIKLSEIETMAGFYGLASGDELLKEVYNQLERDKLTKVLRAKYNEAERIYSKVLSKLGK